MPGAGLEPARPRRGHLILSRSWGSRSVSAGLEFSCSSGLSVLLIVDCLSACLGRSRCHSCCHPDELRHRLDQDPRLPVLVFCEVLYGRTNALRKHQVRLRKTTRTRPPLPKPSAQTIRRPSIESPTGVLAARATTRRRRVRMSSSQILLPVRKTTSEPETERELAVRGIAIVPRALPLTGE